MAEKTGLKHLESYHTVQNARSTSHPLTNNNHNATTYIETIIKITNIVIVGLLKAYLIPGTILCYIFNHCEINNIVSHLEMKINGSVTVQIQTANK